MGALQGPTRKASAHQAAASSTQTAARSSAQAGARDLLLELRRSVGNRALGRLLHPGLAESGAARPPLLQRACACGGEPGADGECEACRRKRIALQRRAPDAAAASSEAPPIVHEVLRASGEPLAATARAFMEPRFGADFSRVRVHADARAAESARAVSAYAYTVGPHVVFDAGRYAPHTPEGRRLLAHELTHTLQQDGAGESVQTLSLDGSAESAAAEAEAVAAAERIATGGRARVGPTSSPPALRRAAIPEPQALGGCGVCIAAKFGPAGFKPAGSAIHTLIQQAAKKEYGSILINERFTEAGDSDGQLDLLVGLDRLAHLLGLLGKTEPLPPNEPGTKIPDIFDPVMEEPGAEPVIGVAEIKPNSDEGRREGEAVIDKYMKAVRDAHPKAIAVAPFVAPLLLVPIPLPDLTRPKGCPTQKLHVAHWKNGIHLYWCKPPFSELQKNAKCRKCGDEKDKKKPKGKGANRGFGLSINSTGGGKGNAGIAVMINSSGTGYGTAGVSVSYNSQGTAVASASVSASTGSSGTAVAGASASASTGSSSMVAGGASVSTSQQSSATGAGVASAGQAKKSEFTGAGVASTGSSTGGSTTALGEKSSGSAQGQSGRVQGQGTSSGGVSDAGVAEREGAGDAGVSGGGSGGASGAAAQGAPDAGVAAARGEADAGVVGSGGGTSTGNVILPPAPDTPEFKATMAEAQQIEKALGAASGAQAELVRWVASRKPNGKLEVPSAAWVQNFLAATKDLTPEQVELLEQVEWEPATDMSADEMRARINAALTGGIRVDVTPSTMPSEGVPAEKLPAEAKAPPAPDDASTAKEPDKGASAAASAAEGERTTDAEMLAELKRRVREFDYIALRKRGADAFWIPFPKNVTKGFRTVIYYIFDDVAYGADVTIADVTREDGKTYVTIGQSTYVVRQRDGMVSPSRLGGVRLLVSEQP